MKKVMEKKLRDFIKDEEGKISRDKILKVGLGTVSAMSILGAYTSSATAQNVHTSQGAMTANPETCAAVPTNHTSYSSY